MWRRRKVTRITVETEKIWSLRAAPLSRGWCPGCGAEVDLISLQQVGILPQALEDQRKKGAKIHTIKGPDGSVQICLQCLQMLEK